MPLLPANPILAWIISHLLGSVTLLVLLGATGEYVVRRIQQARRPTPTRDELEAEDNRPTSNSYAVLWLLGELAATAVWCIYEGRRVTGDLLFQFETFTTWWSALATPHERAVLVTFFGLVVALGVLFVWLLHRVVWRSYFPNLVRIDAHASRGGIAEPLGRLFSTRPFLDGAAPMVRLYYKHGFRVFPPFAFDRLDLPASLAPQPHALGTVAIRCARVERDMQRGRRYRRTNPAPHGAAPLGEAWREEQIRETRTRKVGTVLSGAVMNTETTRKKWEREATITRMEARGLDALRKSRKSTPPAPSGEGVTGGEHS